MHYSGTLLRGQPDKRPTPLKMPLADVNLDIEVLIFTSDLRPTLWKTTCSHYSVAAYKSLSTPYRKLDMPFKVMDSYFYQTNTALHLVKSENSPTTADDRWLRRR